MTGAATTDQRPLREIRRDETRRLILQSALRLLARGGFAGTSIEAIARETGIATGTIYLYFKNRAALFHALFRLASSWEVTAIENAVSTGSGHDQLRMAVRTFVSRAWHGHRLSHALIAEPVDPLIEAARLDSRAEFARVFSAIIQKGLDDGSLYCEDSQLAGKFITGAITECLIVASAPDVMQADAATRADMLALLLPRIEQMCLQAVGAGRNLNNAAK